MIDAANAIQLIFAFTAMFGIILVWPSTRFRPLSLALLMEASLMLCNFAEESGLSRQLWGETLITPIFGLGFGPALFLFTRGLVFSNKGLAFDQAIHFLPMLLAFLLAAMPQLIIALGTISLVIYLSLCWKLMRDYEQASHDRRSDAQNLTLTWLKLVLILYITAIAVDAIRQNLQTELPISILEPWYIATLLVYLGLCCFLIYKGVHQPELFDGFEQYQKEALEALDPPLDETANSLFEQINRQLLEQKLYRTPRLSLSDLSEHTGLTEKDISWAINQGGGQSFADYINHLRIDEICEEIRYNDNRSLLDLALAAGFNSKSSFNTVFKRMTGKTPSQFQKEALN
ncbi:MAG: helix-turn-helix domain-containing protein [Cellvibrionaceae bacterium]|nr:helix-turn-helix domain-containing protein [Cellvibrionaceae bacterium]